MQEPLTKGFGLWGANVYIHETICKKIEETKLQPKNKFYSKLNMKDVSDQDYHHVQQVWSTIEKYLKLLSWTLR